MQLDSPEKAVAEGRISIRSFDHGLQCLKIGDPGLVQLVEDGLNLATAILRVQRQEVLDYLGRPAHQQLLQMLYDAANHELSLQPSQTTSSIHLQRICLTLLLRKSNETLQHVLVDHNDAFGDHWMVPGFLKKVDIDNDNGRVEIEVGYQANRRLKVQSYFVDQSLEQLNGSGVWFRFEGKFPAGRIKQPPFEVDIDYFNFNGPGIPKRINFGIGSDSPSLVQEIVGQ